MGPTAEGCRAGEEVSWGTLGLAVKLRVRAFSAGDSPHSSQMPKAYKIAQQKSQVNRSGDRITSITGSRKSLPQPCPRERPVFVCGTRCHAKYLSRFLERQTPEKPEFNQLGLPGGNRLEL